MEKVTVLIPVIRQNLVEELVKRINENSGLMPGEVLILALEDKERIGCPKMLKQLVTDSHTDFVCFIGDDCLPEKDFLLKAFEKGWNFKKENNLPVFPLVGLNDGFNSGPNSATHFLANKEVLKYLDGEFFSTEYTHCFCDNELVDRMKEKSWYVFAEDAKIFHNNPIVQAEGRLNIDKLDDKDLKRVYNGEVYNRDKMLYLKRKLDRFKSGGGQRLAIAFPIVDDRVYSQFFVSFTTMEKPPFVLLVPQFPAGDFPKDIASVRNNLALQALLMSCTHIVFMDTDQVYPVNTLVKLFPLVESKKFMAVGARVHRRYVPFDPILLRGVDWKFSHVKDVESLSGEVVEVDATGTGCLLVDTEAFFQIPYPWFKITTNPHTGGPVGEDVFFTTGIRKAGGRVAVHTGLEVKHLALIEVNEGLYRMYKKSTGFEWKEGDEAEIKPSKSLNKRLLDESFTLSFASNQVE